MTRTIGVITGTRADFGILLPVLREIRRTPGLGLKLFVTGMHLSKEFGFTLDAIRRAGFRPASMIRTRGFNETPRGMTRSIGRIVEGLSTSLGAHGVDVLLLLGDRGEMLAGAVAATYLRIPVAHIHGGERSGHVDNAARQAITRLAHVHLAATERSASRLRRMGEETWRIHVVGAPRLDTILRIRRRSTATVLRTHGFDPKAGLILIIQHPTAKDASRAGVLMERTLDAASSFGMNVAAIYPSGDPGSAAIVDTLRRCRTDHALRLYRSLDESEYLELLSATSVLVGNSSSGIIEAPSLRIPVVNIGDRQQGRERAGNVIDVPHDVPAIRRAITKALHDRRFRASVESAKGPYGDGRSSERIARILANLKVTDRLLEKHFTL